MNIKNIILLLVILLFLSKILYDGTKNTHNLEKTQQETQEKNTYLNNNNIIDDENLYINQYLSTTEPNLNIIKKYDDTKINIINNMNSMGKNAYDNNINSSLNNSNKNNLIHFINFLI